MYRGKLCRRFVLHHAGKLQEQKEKERKKEREKEEEYIDLIIRDVALGNANG